MTAQYLFEENNAYNAKVNIDFIEHLIQQSAQDERIQILMSHIVNAHQIWLERILGIPNTISVFGLRPYEELKQQILQNSQLTLEVLSTRNLEESIQYKNTKGQIYINSILQILLHVFNHSSYHRGQINQLLVKEGKQAMITDYIFYNRTEVI